jgi:hypothetical protein
MRTPLIVASRPTDGVKYPTVALRPGSWKFETNITDSKFVLVTPAGDVGLELEMYFEVKTEVYVRCITAGSEPSITVYACPSH